MPADPNFTIYFAGDAYSTERKIMGRQAAGKSFLNGVARTWPGGHVRGLVHDDAGAQAFSRQLEQDGFRGAFSSSRIPDWSAAREAGVLYYPAPPYREFAAKRSLMHPAAFSIFGVTHTLSSTGAMDQVSDLLLPPFQPWDALICTSQAAKLFVERLQDDMRAYWRQELGASKFVNVELPVIPLGVNAPAFQSTLQDRKAARIALGLRDEEVAFLFAGRLSFHAKANPAPMYQALEKVAKGRSITCIEAGVFPNEAARQAFLSAQSALAPSVKFISVDGRDDGAYTNAWRGADIFVSLSDNIQETFGLTPLEAMAAGLPVIVSDWNGYKDTVRDGVDGYRIATILPPPGAAADLAWRYGNDIDNYDYFIGRASMATVVDPEATASSFAKLADDPGLRRQMGDAARKRAVTEFDWPVILRHYAGLSQHLNEIRIKHINSPFVTVPNRADPFQRFAHFPTMQVGAEWIVSPCKDAAERLGVLLQLSMVNYGFNPALLPAETLVEMLAFVNAKGASQVGKLLTLGSQGEAVAMRCLMWLWKFDLVAIRPRRT